MISNFDCPVCQKNDWIDVERFRLEKIDHLTAPPQWNLWWKRIQRVLRPLLLARPRQQIVHSRNLDLLHRIQRRLLFDVWFPSKKVVNLKSQFCNSCGLMVYKPRPTAEDIKAKYQYMNDIPEDIWRDSVNSGRARKMDQLRAARIFKTVSAYTEKENWRVLDYGGGDGRLLLPFLKKNHDVFLVDYREDPLPGITKLASDIAEIPQIEKFDMILCSHVFEHVAEPDRLLSHLHDLLTEDGIIYAEVPQEILAGIRLEENPVMHVNFFTENSFKTLFERQGFSVLELKQKISHYSTYFQEVIWLVAAPVKGKQTSSSRKNDIQKRLRPHRSSILKRLFTLLVLPQIYRIISR